MPNPIKLFANQYWECPRSRFSRTKATQYHVMEVDRRILTLQLRPMDGAFMTSSHGRRLYASVIMRPI